MDLSDPIILLGYLFLGDSPLECIDAGDAGDDGLLDLTDAVVILSMLYLGAGQIAAPYPECGLDATGDALGCSASHCP